MNVSGIQLNATDYCSVPSGHRRIPPNDSHSICIGKTSPPRDFASTVPVRWKVTDKVSLLAPIDVTKRWARGCPGFCVNGVSLTR